MSDFRIVVAEGTFAGLGSGTRTVEGAEIAVAAAPLNAPDQIAEATRDAHGIVLGLQKLGSDEIAVLGPSVKAISRAGIGLDSIDLEAARARGIAVIHQPDCSTNEVATHAVAMLLALNRKLVEADRIVRSGWRGRRAIARLAPLHQMTVGVVGGGAIGRAAIARLAPLAGTVLVYDPFLKDTIEGAERVDSFEELLSRSGAVSLHAPLTPETRHMLGAEQIALLPDGALVVNVARGELVDTAALCAALEAGKLGGAALDVFEREPFPADDPINAVPNLMFSPHVAFLSTEAVRRLETQTFDDLCTYLTKGKVHGGRLAVAP